MSLSLRLPVDLHREIKVYTAVHGGSIHKLMVAALREKMVKTDSAKLVAKLASDQSVFHDLSGDFSAIGSHGSLPAPLAPHDPGVSWREAGGGTDESAPSPICLEEINA